jgi:hypothetical protein
VDGGREVRLGVDPGHVGDEATHLLLVEAPEDQAGRHRLAVQLCQGVAQPVMSIHLHVPVGAQQQQAGVGELSSDELEEQQTRPVGPVEIVEDQDHTRICRGCTKECAGGVEQAESSHLGIQRRRGKRSRACSDQFGHDLGELARRVADLRDEGGERAGGGEGAQRLSPRPIGWRSLTFVAATQST